LRLSLAGKEETKLNLRGRKQKGTSLDLPNTAVKWISGETVKK